MNKFLILLLSPVMFFGQVQIGIDIDGELSKASENSGASISISADGSVVAIGAPGNNNNGSNSGHVRIFKNISNIWVQIGNDINGEATADFSGTSISLSADGSVVAIGAYLNDGNGLFSGHVRIFKNVSDVWTQIGNDIDGVADDYLGTSVSLSSDGSVVAIGSPVNDYNKLTSGHIRVFKNISGTWVQIGNNIEREFIDTTLPNTLISVSLSSNGSVLALGSPLNDGNGEDSGYVRVYSNISDVWTQVGNDIDGEAAADYSGKSISLSSDGSVVAIGAILNDGNGEDSGHVRIFKNVFDVWTQIGNDIDGEAEGDHFGTSVSLSSDGSVVAIGAYLNDGNGEDSGHVRIYKNISNVWTQIGTDINGETSVDHFGSSLSLSSDGSIVAIGAPDNDGNGFESGHVRIYKNISDVWTQVGSDIDGSGILIGGSSGGRVSLSSNGKILAIGARENNGNGERSGHVRILENISGTWTQIGDDIDGEAERDLSGSSISLSSNGNIVAIGAVFNDGNEISSGHVRVFENILGVWTQIGNDIDGEVRGDLSGYSIGLSSDGNILVIGAAQNDGNGTSSGHVRFFENVLGIWTQIGDDIDGEAAGDRSGSRLSLSSNGSVIAIGARLNNGNGEGSGHVRVFENISGIWTQIGNDIDGESAGDFSGESISLSSDGSIIAIGAPGNDGNGENSGHVRVFENISGIWAQIGNNIEGEAAGDLFGLGLSISSDGNVIGIGAPGNDENSGYVSIYKNISDVWTQVGTYINGEAAGDLFGLGLSISSDGSVIAIGASGNDGNGPNSGHVRVYDLSAVLSTESFQKDYFSMYPNPVKDVLNLKLNKGLELKQVNIYNLQSQYLYSVKTSKIDISNLSSGIYFIEVVTDEGKSAKKIVIE